MKLLLIVANFLPEIGSAAHIYHDLGLDLVKRGHEVHGHDESQGPKLPSNDDMNDSTFT